MDDLSNDYIQGYDFDENNENGEVIRQNYNAILSATAKFHANFWESFKSFEKVATHSRDLSRELVVTYVMQ